MEACAKLIMDDLELLAIQARDASPGFKRAYRILSDDVFMATRTNLEKLRRIHATCTCSEEDDVYIRTREANVLTGQCNVGRVQVMIS